MLGQDLGTQGGLAPDLDSAIAQFLDGDVQEAAGAAFVEFCWNKKFRWKFPKKAKQKMHQAILKMRWGNNEDNCRVPSISNDLTHPWWHLLWFCHHGRQLMIAWSRRILEMPCEIQPLLLSISWCNSFAKELKDQIDKRRREDRLGLSLYCVFCWWSRWRTWKKSGNQTLPELLIQLCYRKRCQENDGSAEEAGQIYLKVASHQSVVIQKWAVVQAVVMAMFFRNGEKRWVWSLERESDPHLRKLKNVESWSMGWTVRAFFDDSFHVARSLAINLSSSVWPTKLWRLGAVEMISEPSC